MKALLLLALSLLALTGPVATLHAADDGVVMEQVKAVVPPQYSGYLALATLTIMILGRVWTALLNNGGLRGIWNAVISGTNTPVKLLIACLCLLSLPSCTNPATNNRLGALADLAITYSARRGVLTEADVEALRAANAIILPPAKVERTSGK